MKDVKLGEEMKKWLTTVPLEELKEIFKDVIMELKCEYNGIKREEENEKD